MQMDDRQTDHDAKKSVGIGGIAFDAKAIPPNNVISFHCKIVCKEQKRQQVT